MSPAALQAMPEEALMQLREELAEAVNPLLLKLEAVDDELGQRRRAERRARILSPAHLEGPETQEVL